MRKLCVVCLVVVFLTLLSPLVSAEWESVSQTGSWNICERDHWKETLPDTVGFAEWGNKSVTSFTGYYSTVEFLSLTCGATGWGFWDNYAETRVDVWFNFTGVGGDRIVLNLCFERRVDLWGAIGGLGVISTVRENPVGYYGKEAGSLGYQTDAFSFQGYTAVYAYENGGNLTVVVYNYQSLSENPKLMTTATFPVGGAWFGDVSINVAVRHLGNHPSGFEGFLLYENIAYTVGTLPTEKGLGENILDTFVRGCINFFSAVPDWVKAPVNMVYTYSKWLVPIVSIVVNALATVLPFLPLILLFYGLDALITSWWSGSFKPVGVMFLSLYSLASSLISAVVSIAGTIWDFIHFW